MTVWNLGSINADHFYAVPHVPAPGETLAATGLATGLGGKGANQSVAAARAGAEVRHIGCLGPDGGWARERLAGWGIDITHVAEVETPTGHAIINVAEDGENAIVIFPGANAQQSPERIEAALAEAKPGDTLLIQNETSAQVAAARAGAARGMRVVYSAAPFDPDAVRAVLPHVSLLVMNAGEAAALRAALGADPGVEMLVTLGPDGARWVHSDGIETVPAPRVTPVDTTGAGDTFIGYVAAGLDRGMEPIAAMRLGTAAAALKVTRRGTADAIPSAVEVAAFQEANGASSPQS